jgi:hypothetical protein
VGHVQETAGEFRTLEKSRAEIIDGGVLLRQLGGDI